MEFALDGYAFDFVVAAGATEHDAAVACYVHDATVIVAAFLVVAAANQVVAAVALVVAFAVSASIVVVAAAVEDNVCFDAAQPVAALPADETAAVAAVVADALTVKYYLNSHCWDQVGSDLVVLHFERDQFALIAVVHDLVAPVSVELIIWLHGAVAAAVADQQFAAAGALLAVVATFGLAQQIMFAVGSVAVYIEALGHYQRLAI